MNLIALEVFHTKGLAFKPFFALLVELGWLGFSMRKCI